MHPRLAQVRIPENTLQSRFPGDRLIRKHTADTENRIRHLRTLFLSDIHLGTRGCQADVLLDFLSLHHADTIYLVGDIIDGWRLKRKRYWPENHQAVIDELLARGRAGIKIIYLPGNHDEFLKDTQPLRFGCVEFMETAEFETAAGDKYLVLHGDQYDLIVQKAKWLAFLGDRFYAFALWTNTWVNNVRRKFGLNYWSLGAFAKQHVKQFVNVISAFEGEVTKDIKDRGLDGVICGHIHHATDQEMNGKRYLNTGDWVESCTAIVETHDGVLEIVRWRDSGAHPDARNSDGKRALKPAGKLERERTVAA
jgi:UDP-2,3-diacylglucosamine pyrophosphatase LpxH